MRSRQGTSSILPWPPSDSPNSFEVCDKSVERE
jgi:hypothetical protein